MTLLNVIGGAIFFEENATFSLTNSSKSSLCFRVRQRETEGAFPLEHVLCGRIFLSSQHLAPISSGRAAAYCSPLYRCHVQINQLHTFCCHWSQTLHPHLPLFSRSLKSYVTAGVQWLVCRPSLSCLTSRCGCNLMLMSWACRLHVFSVANNLSSTGIVTW